MIDVFPRLFVVALLALLTHAGCTGLDHVERRTFAPDSLLSASAATSEAGPIKAHMPDGSIYVFSSWVVLPDERRITGTAAHLSAVRDTLARGPMSVPLDSVALVETNVRNGSSAPAYFAALAVASAALTLYCVTTPKACFGSCPTIYSTTTDGHVLEAESFSHSIAPLFEMRDVDRIGAQPDAGGLLRLEVRNEALETHYINHLELIEVTHEAGAFAVPDKRGGALVLNDFASDVAFIDRAGTDISRDVTTADGVAFETDPSTLASATPDDAFDYIDVALAAPPADSAAVLLRFRASLLSTVLFYDFMLAGQGIDAIDWLTRRLDTISGAVEIGEFYTRWMGVRIAVRRGDAYHGAARLGGAGPIAWDDAAVMVPVTEPDSLRLRITFLADAFRFDRIAIARRADRRPARVIPLTRIESSATSGHAADQSARDDASSARTAEAAALDAKLHEDAARPDERYLTTHPGTRFDAVFDTGGAGADHSRTFFLASQGYYIEWIRREWLQREADDLPALATNDMLLQALKRWRAVKADYEDQFFRTKIPVR